MATKTGMTLLAVICLDAEDHEFQLLPLITLRKSSTFRKVYWSPRFVRMSVCLSVCL